MTFVEHYNNFPYDSLKSGLEENRPEIIRSLITKSHPSLSDLFALLSPAASKQIRSLASRAHDITIQRFGKIISFYVPMYLSNECSNSCVYCGFNTSKKFARTTLSGAEIQKELKKIKTLGFDSILLLTGEAPSRAGTDYIAEAIKMAKEHFTFVGLEIYPMSTEEYGKLVDAGANGLTIYQETYDSAIYDAMHIKGKKKDFAWRLEAPERALEAGFRKIGLGALLGLSDWRFEAAMLAYHIDYLTKKFWKSDITLSFPRINPVETSFHIPYPVDNKSLIQMICALRLYLNDVGFIISTRETPEIRDHLISLCTTQISAGSKTNPGGYSLQDDSENQFDISDTRDLEKMMEVVRSKGYDPVIKDWEQSFKKSENT